MKQLTKKQAITIYESGEWKKLTHEQIVRFQLFQDLLCIPFGIFHDSISKVLGRPVFTHEFSSSNYDNLILEYLGEKDAPTLDEINEIIGYLGDNKTTIVLI